MSVPVIAFFDNRGGVGKTSLVYHLACMYADLDVRVVAADLDPQANLTAAFLDDEELERIWPEADDHPETIFGCAQPLIRGVGDVRPPIPQQVEDRIQLVAGDLALSRFEDALSEVWPKCNDRDERAFRITSAFWRTMQTAAEQSSADLVLMDLGPNLGAINRAALISADFVVAPLAPDLFSLQGLHNLGPTLRRWRTEWQERRQKNPVPEMPLPSGSMAPAGYVVLQHAVRLDRPVRAYEKWIGRIPAAYQKYMLDDGADVAGTPSTDPHCLKILKHYRSLMPMAQEARKPMFRLLPGDGAIGSHFQAARDVRKDFAQLADALASRTGVTMPSPIS